MRFGIIAFVSGVFYFQLLPFAPSPQPLLAILAGGAVLVWHSAALRILGWFCLGLFWAWLQARAILATGVESGLAGQDLVVTGTVCSIPDTDRDPVRFEFDIDTLAGQPSARRVGRVLLSWYREAPALRAGQRWRLLVRLKPAHGLRNPGGFDYEGWLFARGIRSTGYVRASPSNHLLGAARFSSPVARLRQTLRDHIRRALAGHPARGLFEALVIGERSAMRPQSWKIFRRTGTSHLIAISGLHIGMVSGMVFLLMRSVWRRAPGLVARWPAAPAAGVVALGAAVGYAALAGFSIPTRRALIMVAIVLGGMVLRRETRTGQTLLSALALVVLLDPLCVIAGGFWLSFLAVAAIGFSVNHRCHDALRWRSWLRVQWGVFLGLLPVVAYFFGQTSVIALPVNLVAVPWFSFVLVPLTLVSCAASCLSDDFLGLLRGAAELLALSERGLGWCAELSWASLSIPQMHLWQWCCAVLGVALLIAPQGLPGRPLGLLLVANLFLSSPEMPVPGEFRFTLLDVGQGLSAVIQTARHALVYDAGPRYAPGRDAGEAVVLPFLRRRGIRHVHRLVLSHGDLDHIGGAESILAGIPVRRVSSGEPRRLGRSVHAGACRAGETWNWDGVEFSFLHPDPQRSVQGNDASCVLLVAGPGGRLLLTGDLGATEEKRLVRQRGADLRTDVVVAAHHGSRSSSTPALVQATAAEYALLSSGFRNRYRFPHPSVVERWADNGADVINTARQGAISFWFAREPERLLVETERGRRPRYWSWVPAD